MGILLFDIFTEGNKLSFLSQKDGVPFFIRLAIQCNHAYFHVCAARIGGQSKKSIFAPRPI